MKKLLAALGVAVVAIAVVALVRARHSFRIEPVSMCTNPAGCAPLFS